MGMEALFCCFGNQRPIFPAATGIGASIIPFAFLIWGLCDLGFQRKGVEAIYIIAFVLVVMTLVGFVTVLILLIIAPNPSSYRTVNNLGRVLCLVIIFMCIIALIFLFVSFIILLVDYSKLRKCLRDDSECEEDYDSSWGDDEVFDPNVNKISSKEWAAVIVPLIFSFICLPVMALAANYLYKVFSNKMNTPPNLPVNITQNTIPTLPNIPQPGMFPNNNGPVPPMGNNIAYPVGIQQSGININQK
jgi:hypothetical protein